jgi:integrase
MPKMKLTDLTIKALKPPESFTTYWDTSLPGFGVRCSPKGKKTFTVMYGEDRQRVTIGVYPLMTLSDARNSAKHHLYAKNTPTGQKCLNDARSNFLTECQNRLRPATIKQYRFHLDRLTKENLDDIKRNDIDINNPYAVATLKAFFNWCIQNELIDRNPFQFIKAKTNKRERVLLDEEIRAIWAYDYPPYSNIVKLLFLTGLRRTEVMNLQLDGDIFRLPPEHTKNARGHTIPATTWAKQHYEEFEFNGWSKGKSRMDRETGITDYVIHDIRRVYATLHAKIGTPIHVIEKLLNHQSGSVSGLVAVYNRYNYQIEATKAVTNYEKYLKEII